MNFSIRSTPVATADCGPFRAGFALMALALSLWLTPVPVLAQCTGDCTGDNEVTVDEIVRGVNLALGSLELSICPVFDSSGDGLVTVDELVQAILAALNGCPASATATPTEPAPTATSGPIDTATSAPTATESPTPGPTSPPTPTATATATVAAVELGDLIFSTTNGDTCDQIGSCPAGCGLTAAKSCFFLNPPSSNQCCGTSNTHWNAASSTSPNLFLRGATPAADGRASLTLAQPVVIGDRKATSFAAGYVCWRIRQDPAFAGSADSFVDCDGGTRADVTFTIDSNGMGVEGAPSLSVDSSGDPSAPAGAGVIRVLMQSSETSSDANNCDTVNWTNIPDQAIAMATGTVTNTILNPRQGGTASASLRGEPFDCAQWGSGVQGSLVFPLFGLDQMIPLSGTKDVANAVRLRD